MARAWWAIWFFAATLLVGCSDGAATVSGIVTLDGEPIVGGPQMYGTVTFYRQDGAGAPAVGVVDEAGRYTLKTGAQSGLAPGAYAVAIAVKRIELPTAPSGMPRPHLVTPEKYASATDSGLEADVAAGSNTLNFQLESHVTGE